MSVEVSLQGQRDLPQVGSSEHDGLKPGRKEEATARQVKLAFAARDKTRFFFQAGTEAPGGKNGFWPIHH